jgi:hypothetical protein
MAEFVINRDITTDTPVVEVTVTADKPLPIGRNLFRLTVSDDSGNLSKPDQVEVIVADQEAPTAILTAPRIVAFGKSFNLSAERSFDAGGGKIVRFQFTYLGPAT